jgi:hypothetical protein
MNTVNGFFCTENKKDTPPSLDKLESYFSTVDMMIYS